MLLFKNVEPQSYCMYKCSSDATQKGHTYTGGPVLDVAGP